MFSDYDYTLVPYTQENSCWGFPKFITWTILRDEIDQLIPNDSLTIFCKVKTLLDIDHEIGPKSINLPMTDLLDYDQLWITKEQTGDVVFHVGENKQPFYAHKSVLGKLLWYYEELTTLESLEIEIQNVDPVLFDAIRNFLYKRDMSTFVSLDDKLLSAANMVISTFNSNLCNLLFSSIICLS